MAGKKIHQCIIYGQQKEKKNKGMESKHMWGKKKKKQHMKKLKININLIIHIKKNT